MKQRLDGENYGDGENNMMDEISVSKNFYSRKIQLDIANWNSREPFLSFADMEKKIINKLQRKYKLKVDPKELKKKIKDYRKIYNTVAKNLHKYIISSDTGYSDPKYIKNKDLKDFLIKIFPDEDGKTLDCIIGWVVEYEYLR